MIFQVNKKRKIIEVTVSTIIFALLVWFSLLNIKKTYSILWIGVLIIGYLYNLIGIVTFKDYYKLERNILSLCINKKTITIPLSSIKSIERITNLGGGRLNSGISYFYFIAYRNEKFKIISRLKNEKGKDLISVLTKRYKLKIVEKTSFFKPNQ